MKEEGGKVPKGIRKEEGGTKWLFSLRLSLLPAPSTMVVQYEGTSLPGGALYTEQKQEERREERNFEEFWSGGRKGTKLL